MRDLLKIDIESRPRGLTTPGSDIRECGCESRKVRSDGKCQWFLCAYHDGFRAGLEAADQSREPEPAWVRGRTDG